jgi:hypothetical protein
MPSQHRWYLGFSHFLPTTPTTKTKYIYNHKEGGVSRKKKEGVKATLFLSLFALLLQQRRPVTSSYLGNPSVVENLLRNPPTVERVPCRGLCRAPRVSSQQLKRRRSFFSIHSAFSATLGSFSHNLRSGDHFFCFLFFIFTGGKKQNAQE